MTDVHVGRVTSAVGAGVTGVLCLGLVACGPPKPQLTAAGNVVTVNQANPPEGYEEIGFVAGSHGYGCKKDGAKGTLDGAMNDLRNRAAAMGADYVRIEAAEAPYFDGKCSRVRHVLRGTAFTSRPKPRDVGFGTCFAVRPDGVILTARHVVEEAERVEVALEGANFIPATVEAVHEEADIAVVRVDTETPSFLRLAPEGAISSGDWVFTIGYPATDVLGKKPKFTDGSVSALEVAEDLERGFMQITVPIQPGNSGGPLVDESGHVVGITVASAHAATFLRKTGALPQGINFAVDVRLATELFEEPPAPVTPAPEKDAEDPDGDEAKETDPATTAKTADAKSTGEGAGDAADVEETAPPKPERRVIVAQTEASLCAVKSYLKPSYAAKGVSLD